MEKKVYISKKKKQQVETIIVITMRIYNLSKDESFGYKSTINGLIIAIRFLGFIGMIILFISLYNNPSPAVFEIVIWVAVGFLALMVFLEAWQAVNDTGELKLYPLFTLIFAIALGLLAILGSIFQWANWITPAITTEAWYAIILIGALFLVDIGIAIFDKSRFEPKPDQNVSFGTKLKLTLSKQRFTTTFLLMVVGLVILITGSMAEFSWVWNYLVPILLIIPFPIVLLREYSKPNIQFNKSWFKITGLYSVIIEGVIMVILFLVSIYVLWNLFPTGFQEIWEFKSWVGFSYIIMLGVGLLIHAFWGAGRMYDPNAKFFVTDGSDIYPRSHYIVAQIILFILITLNIFYILRIVKQIIESGLNIENGIFLLISSFILILMLEWIEEEYVKYNLITNPNPRRTPNLRRGITWEAFVFVPLIIIVIFSMVLKYLPTEAFFILGLVIIFAFFFMLYPNLRTLESKSPNVTSVLTDKVNPYHKRELIWLIILAITFIGITFVLGLRDEWKLTSLGFVIGLIFSSLFLIYTIYSIVIYYRIIAQDWKNQTHAKPQSQIITPSYKLERKKGMHLYRLK